MKKSPRNNFCLGTGEKAVKYRYGPYTVCPICSIPLNGRPGDIVPKHINKNEAVLFNHDLKQEPFSYEKQLPNTYRLMRYILERYLCGRSSIMFVDAVEKTIDDVKRVRDYLEKITDELNIKKEDLFY